MIICYVPTSSFHVKYCLYTIDIMFVFLCDDNKNNIDEYCDNEYIFNRIVI